jgi:hypothetical protein
LQDAIAYNALANNGIHIYAKLCAYCLADFDAPNVGPKSATTEAFTYGNTHIGTSHVDANVTSNSGAKLCPYSLTDFDAPNVGPKSATTEALTYGNTHIGTSHVDTNVASNSGAHVLAVTSANQDTNIQAYISANHAHANTNYSDANNCIYRQARIFSDVRAHVCALNDLGIPKADHRTIEKTLIGANVSPSGFASR